MAAVLKERRFSPISYTRQELVEEAECLTGMEVASWLEGQPDEVLEEIMYETNELIWFGPSYLGSLESAMRSAYAGQTAPGRRFGNGDNSCRVTPCRGVSGEVSDQVIGYEAGWSWVAEIRHCTSEGPECDRVEAFVRTCEAGSDLLYANPDDGSSLAAALARVSLGKLERGRTLSESFIEGAVDSWYRHLYPPVK